MDILAIFVMILLGLAGLITMRLGWRYRTGKTVKPYFLPNSNHMFYALLGIPIGLFWLSLSAGMFMGIFLPETDFLTNLSMVVLAISASASAVGFVISLFPNSFIHPNWVKRLEQNHPEVRYELIEEVEKIGVNEWAQTVQTQEDLEKWTLEVFKTDITKNPQEDKNQKELARQQMQQNKHEHLRDAFQRGLNGPVSRTKLNRKWALSNKSEEFNGLFYHFELPFEEDGSFHTLAPVSDKLASPSSRLLAKLNAKSRSNQTDKILNQLTSDFASSNAERFDILSSITKSWPILVAEGGELMPSLLSIAEQDYNLTSQALVSQLVGDIVRDTTASLSDQASRLLCDRCLTRYSSHDVNLVWLKGNVTYYGCRICSRSKEFIEYNGKVIAVLDNQMKEKYHLQDDTLRVNWLSHRAIFDFDEVELVQATDEDVERFVVQVGNDTDVIWLPRYKQMRCIVGVNCSLSENTIRIIKRFFENTEIETTKQQYVV